MDHGQIGEDRLVVPGIGRSADPVDRLRHEETPYGGHAPVKDGAARDLEAHVEGEVRFDAGSRALYATDGSNYRQVPIGVVVPKSMDDVLATVARTSSVVLGTTTPIGT